MPGRSVGSQKVLSEKSKVKFYFSNVQSRVIPILKRIEVGDYPSKIARLYLLKQVGSEIDNFHKRLQEYEAILKELQKILIESTHFA